MGPFVDYVLCLVLVVMHFIYRVHKDRFKSVVSFEEDLYTGMSKVASKFLTEARNIGN